MDDDHIEESQEEETTFRDEILSRDEIYLTGKENIEGLACLINIFIGRMACQSKNSAIINIDNDESFDEDRILKGQLFF